MSRRTSQGQRNIDDLVNSIPALTRGDLLARWEKHYGTRPHKLISTRLLVRAVAHAVQAEQHGGLAKRTRTELLRLAEAAGVQAEVKSLSGDRNPAVRTPRSGRHARPRRGTRLVREWNGKSHVVEVVDKGFAWQGQTYRSLSAIASLITGCRWSGPRFFGITS
jgi:hypothetical protein